MEPQELDQTKARIHAGEEVTLTHGQEAQALLGRLLHDLPRGHRFRMEGTPERITFVLEREEGLGKS